MAEHSSNIDLSDFSIIIPMKSDEAKPVRLLSQLKPTNAEIITSKEGTRARSLNEGAKRATKDILWFLHADSITDINGLNWLNRELSKKPNALHYFKLKFSDDGPALTSLNAWGANIRSRFFKTPFGDQGFCLHKRTFQEIGNFPEDVRYGEDHVFIWRAHQKGISLNQIPAYIETSARRYREDGWLKTTLLFQYLWIKQALPELWFLLKKK